MAQQRLWSVTELLKLAIPAPQLLAWAVRTTAEYAVQHRGAWLAMADADPDGAISYLRDARWRVSTKAADRGKAIHRHAQALALGAPPPAPEPGTEAHVAQFERFLAAYQPTYVAAEAPVYNLAYGYAGTLDAIVRIDGELCVLDYKTTDKGPDATSRPPYDEVALQLCAYARAERLGTSPPVLGEVRRRRYYTWDDSMGYTDMPATTGALALMVSPVDYELHPVRVDDTVWACFLHAREVARWVLEVSRTAIGPPLAAPQPPAPAPPQAAGEPEPVGQQPEAATPTGEAAVLAEAEQLRIDSGGQWVGDDDQTFDEWMRSLPPTPPAEGATA